MAYKDDTWLSLEAMADPRNKETQMVLEAQSNGHILLLHKEIVPFFTQQISKITGQEVTQIVNCCLVSLQKLTLIVLDFIGNKI